MGARADSSLREVKESSPEEKAVGQGLKGWIGAASISLSVNRGSWTGFLFTPNFHNFNARDPTLSIGRDIALGLCILIFAEDLICTILKASQSIAGASVDCSAVLLSCQMTEGFRFQDKEFTQLAECFPLHQNILASGGQ